MRSFQTFLLLIILSGCASMTQQKIVSPTDYRYYEGNHCFENKDFETAIKKYSEFPSIRVIVPILFVFGIPLIGLFPSLIYLYSIYLLFIIIATLREKEDLITSLYLFISFPIMHISHGIGFFRGLIDMFILKKDKKLFEHTR